jgi:hypothetical protein
MGMMGVWIPKTEICIPHMALGLAQRVRKYVKILELDASMMRLSLKLGNFRAAAAPFFGLPPAPAVPHRFQPLRNFF